MGTVRTFTPTVKALMRERIDRVAAGIAASHGPNCAIDVKDRILSNKPPLEISTG